MTQCNTSLNIRTLADFKPRRSRNRATREGLTLTGGGYEYFIARERLRTPMQALHWIDHLHRKRWITKQDLRDVVAYADPDGERWRAVV